MVLAALLAACKTEPYLLDTDMPRPFKVVSFNAGLATGFVPGADSRLPQIAGALQSVDADVICLQEVWTPEQVAAIEATVGDTFPYRHFPAASQSADATCAPGELDTLLTCLEDNCDSTCVDDVPTCAFESCGVQVLLLPKDCMRCAMANVGNDPAEVADLCVADPVEFAYGGSYGTGILSRRPLSNVEEHVFTSTSNRRGVTHATIDAGVPVDVYCTHLTAVFDTIPYPRETGSWGGEQLVQANELLTFLDETGGDHQVLIGDLNTGPNGDDGVVAEAVGSYDALVAGGLASPYVELDGRCTFCASNPILAAQGETTDVLIDHVMTRGMTASAAGRILDGEIVAESCSVDLSTSALSDHYGITVTLEAAAP
jgi:endonuclease/exonuclease/phosphatase family metal-dependent hydrolase